MNISLILNRYDSMNKGRVESRLHEALSTQCNKTYIYRTMLNSLRTAKVFDPLAAYHEH
jgi:hypothetical protein